MERNYVEYAYSLGVEKPLEGMHLDKKVEASASTTSMVGEAILDANKWLPFASEVYNVSPSIKDYVLVPVIIMPSDLPNRNGIGFPFKELSWFNPETGCLGYQTWKGKPTFVEHCNSDHTQAKGVILGASLRKMPNTKGEVWKVVLLSAWDRNRDSILANSILTGERPCFSMGAMCGDYSCSICGSLHSKGGCEHVTLGKPSFKIIEGKLAYLEVSNFIGFELSSVKDPAFSSATINSKTDVFMWG